MKLFAIVSISSSQKPRILITRPASQQSAFAAGCANLGFEPICLPCISLEAISSSDFEIDQKIKRTKNALFTSVPAVQYAHAIRPLPWLNMSVFAIGKATQDALSDRGQLTALDPQPPYNSEAFLGQLSDRPKDTILIIKGEGGRELIADSLNNNGWQVLTHDVYRRVMTTPPAAQVDELFLQTPPDIVSISSNAILDALIAISKHHLPLLQRRPLIVNSKRCADYANRLGFIGEILLAEFAGDEGQLAVLAQWRKVHRHGPSY